MRLLGLWASKQAAFAASGFFRLLCIILIPIRTTPAYALIPRSAALPFLFFTLFALRQPLFAGEFDFLTEHPGKLTATVTGSHQMVGKGDAAAFKRNLERLRGLLAKQPVFTPPRGVEVIGYFRPNDQQPQTNRVPIPGFGYLRFHFYHRNLKSGKPVRICCTTDEIYVSINDPGQGFDPYGAAMFPTKVLYEPRQVGELAGFPVYRMDSGNEVILLSKKTTPLWIPLTREEYVRAWLTHWEKEAAQSPPQDTLTPQIVRQHRAALAAMSAEERKMQARTRSWDPFEPSLSPVGSEEGQALVRINPAWFNPSLPRSAFQLIALQFSYTGNLNHEKPGPTEFGDIAPFRVWQALHSSDWAEIGGALTDK